MKIKRLFNYKNTQYDEQLKAVPHNFAVKHDENKSVTEMTIYGIIGESYWSDKYTSAIDVDNALKDANGNNITIRLNSPGGSAFDGIAIYNRLMSYKKEFGAKITIYVDGWACSAASVIAMAADDLIMGLGSMFMIHEASNIVWGTKGDFRGEADVLEELEDGIIDIYMTKANVDREEIRAKVDAETWFSANKTVEIGFATATSSTAEDKKDEEITNLKNQMQAMQDQLAQINNQQIKAPSNKKMKRFL